MIRNTYWCDDSQWIISLETLSISRSHSRHASSDGAYVSQEGDGLYPLMVRSEGRDETRQ